MQHDTNPGTADSSTGANAQGDSGAGLSTLRILAVASGGGHWTQLMRLRSAFEGHDVAFVTVSEGYATEVTPARLHVVTDSSRWSKFRLVRTAFEMARVLWRERPDVVLTTGAAPGLFAVILGRLAGARTVWIDSLANVERMSLSGRLARPFASLWLTQWPHLAADGGPHCLGAVL